PALSSAIDHTKIPAPLDSLCAADNPLLRKVHDARGKNAAPYELIPPDASTPAASKSGKGLPVHAVRPVFRALGMTAADVYEAIELTPGLTGRAIARATGHSPTTVLDAIALLTSNGLNTADRDGGN